MYFLSFNGSLTEKYILLAIGGQARILSPKQRFLASQQEGWQIEAKRSSPSNTFVPISRNKVSAKFEHWLSPGVDKLKGGPWQ